MVAVAGKAKMPNPDTIGARPADCSGGSMKSVHGEVPPSLISAMIARKASEPKDTKDNTRLGVFLAGQESAFDRRLPATALGSQTPGLRVSSGEDR